MYFINPSYDPYKRNFIGDIDWENNPLTGKLPKYRYNLIFQKDFCTIKYGTISGYDKENMIKSVNYISNLEGSILMYSL